jgi:sulfite exporter TauE/SafE
MIWTALIMGFAGSLHCLGMCSPLAMAVTNMTRSIILNRLLYNFGRILTYGIMGMIISTIGMSFSFIKYQNLLSIVLGVALLVIGFAGISTFRIPFVSQALGRFSVFLKGLFSGFIQKKRYGSIFLLGSLNGILPCGLSFLALTYCLTLTTPTEGFIFMVWFGMGTLPVMIGLTTFFYWLLNKFHVNGRTITTGMLMLSGVVLIARVFIVHLPHANSLQEGFVDIVLCR